MIGKWIVCDWVLSFKQVQAVQCSGVRFPGLPLPGNGKITWYVNPVSCVPGGDLLKIEHFADVQREKWEKWLDSMPELKRYEKLLETVPADIMLYAMNLNGELWQKINYLKQVCYEKSYF